SSALAHGGRTEPLVAVFSHHRECEAGTSSCPFGKLTETGPDPCLIGIAVNPRRITKQRRENSGNPIEKHCKLAACGEKFGVTALIAGRASAAGDDGARWPAAGRTEAGITGRVTHQPGAPGGDRA